MIEINNKLRANIRTLKPYTTARDEYKGSAEVYIDANENPFGKDYSRYPDPYQYKLKERIAEIKAVDQRNIFIGNGSDEIIDLVFRAFCNPGVDNVLALDPSYGMYQVSASINDITIKKIALDSNFELDFQDIYSAIDEKTKAIFLCSPNNPSGNCFPPDEMLELVSKFDGIVVIDEAYIDFCNQDSMKNYVLEYNNLVVMQTLSKAYGLAALRLGVGIMHEELIGVFNKIKSPYNISLSSQQAGLEALKDTEIIKEEIINIIEERERMKVELTAYAEVKQIYYSEANFLLVKVVDANELYNYLINNGIIVRNRHGQKNCDQCVRITIGTKEENQKLLQKLNEYYHAEDIVFG
jgi:histidinol-phosphate aminotransferase